MREEPLGKAKPFDIPKRVVWEAYQRVKANRGAAGVDDQSIEAFDQDVKNNLFKLWNRIGLTSRHLRPWVWQGRDAGGMTGFSISTFGPFSTPFPMICCYGRYESTPTVHGCCYTLSGG